VLLQGMQLLRVLQMLLTHKALAETIGTFTMVFVGAGSIVLSERFPQAVPPFVIPIAWGLTIALMIFAVGHISGAHFNPAVTLAFAATKRLPASHVFLYWGSQLCGGLMAVGLLEVLKKL
jgi:aquaporin NIP